MQGQNAGLNAGFSEKRTEGEGHTVVMAVPYSPEGEGLPYYEVDVAAGPLELYGDTPEFPALKLVIPGFEDCDLALNVWGDSMYPRYNAGDIIICKRVRDKSEVVYGEPYLIITAERRVLKYLKKASQKEYWLLVSENDHYDPFEVEIDKVLHLFLVKGKIKRNAI